MSAASLLRDDRSATDIVAGLIETAADPRHGAPARPDFVLVTGDVAAAATPDQYDLAQQILTATQETLALDRRQFVIVPGSGDVNRDKCKAHFLNRRGDGKPPAPPYWEKWLPFAAFAREFLGVELARDQPWDLVE